MNICLKQSGRRNLFREGSVDFRYYSKQDVGAGGGGDAIKSRLNKFNGKAYIVFPFDNTLSPDIFFTVGIGNSDGHNIFMLDFAHFPGRDKCPAQAYIEKGAVVSSVLMGEDDIRIVGFSLVEAFKIESLFHFEGHFLVYQGLRDLISRTIKILSAIPPIN